jgi:MoxR-like ATPase
MSHSFSFKSLTSQATIIIGEGLFDEAPRKEGLIHEAFGRAFTRYQDFIANDVRDEVQKIEKLRLLDNINKNHEAILKQLLTIMDEHPLVSTLSS